MAIISKPTKIASTKTVKLATSTDDRDNLGVAGSRLTETGSSLFGFKISLIGVSVLETRFGPLRCFCCAGGMPKAATAAIGHKISIKNNKAALGEIARGLMVPNSFGKIDKGL